MNQEIRWYGAILDSIYTGIRILTLSDLHKGSPFSSVPHFLRTLKFVGDNDDCRLVFAGDLMDTALKNSKSDVYGQTETPKQQKEWLIETLKPYATKILGMCTGNHENRVARDTSFDPTEEIATALGVPYRPEGILLKIMFGSGNSSHVDRPFVFWQYSTHGYGGARTKSAKAVKVERTSTFIQADVYTMSHDHSVNVAPDITLIPDNRGTLDEKTGFTTGLVKERRKMLVKTNAFLKWGGYGEMGGFSPTDLSTPVIYLLTPKSEYWNLFPEDPRQTVKVLA